MITLDQLALAELVADTTWRPRSVTPTHVKVCLYINLEMTRVPFTMWGSCLKVPDNDHSIYS